MDTCAKIARLEMEVLQLHRNINAPWQTQTDLSDCEIL